MPPISHKYVSPEEMAREAMKLMEVIAKVLEQEESSNTTMTDVPDS